MPPFPFGFDVTVQRPGRPDRFGNPQPTVDHVESGCIAAPAGSTEYVGTVATVIDKDTVWASPDADILAKDLLVIPAGQAIPAGTYFVDGDPQRFVNGYTATRSATVVHLTRGTG